MLAEQEVPSARILLGVNGSSQAAVHKRRIVELEDEHSELVAEKERYACVMK